MSRYSSAQLAPVLFVGHKMSQQFQQLSRDHSIPMEVRQLATRLSEEWESEFQSMLENDVERIKEEKREQDTHKNAMRAVIAAHHHGQAAKFHQNETHKTANLGVDKFHKAAPFRTAGREGLRLVRVAPRDNGLRDGGVR